MDLNYNFISFIKINEMDELQQRFINFRTGDICFSAGENIGDLMIFVGRQSTIQHSCILVWLDKKAVEKHEVKVHPYYVDENTTVLSFLGLAQGKKLDILMNEKHKGLILYHPDELFLNAPIVYIRPLSKKYITDEYVCIKMKEYIDMYHLKMQYAYGKSYIVTVGLGLDLTGRHPTGELCSGSIYRFLELLCEFPEFKIEDITQENINEIRTKGIKSYKNIEYDEYKVVDALDYMYLPDFFSSDYNTHPALEKEEVRIISSKSEEDVTVQHPYLIMFIVLIIIIVFLFYIISNYCESCNSGNGICRINKKDFFDLL